MKNYLRFLTIGLLFLASSSLRATIWPDTSNIVYKYVEVGDTVVLNEYGEYIRCDSLRWPHIMYCDVDTIIYETKADTTASVVLLDTLLFGSYNGQNQALNDNDIFEKHELENTVSRRDINGECLGTIDDTYNWYTTYAIVKEKRYSEYDSILIYQDPTFTTRDAIVRIDSLVSFFVKENYEYCRYSYHNILHANDYSVFGYSNVFSSPELCEDTFLVKSEKYALDEYEERDRISSQLVNKEDKVALIGCCEEYSNETTHHYVDTVIQTVYSLEHGFCESSFLSPLADMEEAISLSFLADTFNVSQEQNYLSIPGQYHSEFASEKKSKIVGYVNREAYNTMGLVFFEDIVEDFEVNFLQMPEDLLLWHYGMDSLQAEQLFCKKGYNTLIVQSESKRLSHYLDSIFASSQKDWVPVIVQGFHYPATYFTVKEVNDSLVPIDTLNQLGLTITDLKVLPEEMRALSVTIEFDIDTFDYDTLHIATLDTGIYYTCEYHEFEPVDTFKRHEEQLVYFDEDSMPLKEPSVITRDSFIIEFNAVSYSALLSITDSVWLVKLALGQVPCHLNYQHSDSGLVKDSICPELLMIDTIYVPSILVRDSIAQRRDTITLYEDRTFGYKEEHGWLYSFNYIDSVTGEYLYTYDFNSSDFSDYYIHPFLEHLDWNCGTIDSLYSTFICVDSVFTSYYSIFFPYQDGDTLSYGCGADREFDFWGTVIHQCSYDSVISVKQEPYIPFISESKLWVEQLFERHWRDGIIKESTSYLYFEGDTVLNVDLGDGMKEYRYHKLFRQQFNAVSFLDSITNDTIQKPTLAACLFEDTIRRRVYSGDQLLYDFNLGIGGRFQHDRHRFNVTAIEPVLLSNGEKRMKYIFDNDEWYIEGIGGVKWLENPVGSNWLRHPRLEGEIICYSEFTTPLYGFCEYPEYVATSVELVEGNTLKLYPNPATEMVYIDLGEGSHTAQLTIIDLSGKEIIKKEINQRLYPLSLGRLKRGIYLVSVELNGRNEVEKLIVQ